MYLQESENKGSRLQENLFQKELILVGNTISQDCVGTELLIYN